MPMITNPQRSFRNALIGVAIVVTIFGAIGCSDSLRTRPLSVRLANRGSYLITDKDPYLAPNLMLDRELGSDPDIRGFLKTKGKPFAIQVQKGFLSPLTVFLYYPEKGETYRLEKGGLLWLISGPEPLEGDELQQILALASTPTELPTVDSSSDDSDEKTDESSAPSPTTHSKILFQPEKSHSDASRSGTSLSEGDGDDMGPIHEGKNLELTPSHSESTKRVASTTNESAENNRSVKKTGTFKEKVQALVRETKSGEAELTPKGDVVHYVSFDGETLSNVAAWYTYDKSNVGKIARINQRKADDKLALGDSIVIPSYLVRNKTLLTKTALKDLGGL